MEPILFEHVLRRAMHACGSSLLRLMLQLFPCRTMAFAALLASVLLPGATAAAQESLKEVSPARLADLSLEELMNESITSVSKREQKVSTAPAAVHVITSEDIRRSGATTIAEALRMAPGLSVARLGSHDWVITSRGFGDQFAGNLLVLIDGRAVYTPFFSGVYWDSQDLILEDLERIEVIRGPGATLWGANAVNGVINIITKKSSDTQGGLLTGGGGSEWYGGGLRYGGKIKEDAFYRVYVKYDDHDGLVDPAGNDANDSWRKLQGGFRSDWQPFEATSLTLQGDYHTAELNEPSVLTSLTPPFRSSIPADDEVSGGNILGRWTQSFSENSVLSLQTFFSRDSRQDDALSVRQDIYDAELQHQLGLGARHNLVYGAGYRYTHFKVRDSFFLTFNDPHPNNQTFNAFLQDEITLVEDRLKLTLGSKFEHNDFTGLEIQPGGRLLWTPHERHTFWGSVSRAVRTPNFVENHLRINHTTFDPDGPGPAPTTLIAILPNQNVGSETLMAYELGYRTQPRSNVFFDIAAFYNVYEDLIVEEAGAPFFEAAPAPAHLTIPSTPVNRMKGRTYGVEFAPSWQVTDDWKLSAGYTWLNMDLRSSAAGAAGESAEGNSPKHQFQVRSLWNLPHNLSFDTTAFYVSRLSGQTVPDYLRLDLRLGWRPSKNLELSVGAMNLLEDQHAEYRSISAPAVDVQRSFYGKLTWRF